MYDQTGPGVRAHINSFIAAYSLPLDELLEKDLDKYPVSRLRSQAHCRTLTPFSPAASPPPRARSRPPTTARSSCRRATAG